MFTNMNITKSEVKGKMKTYTFRDLKEGDIFSLSFDPNNRLFMKTECVTDRYGDPHRNAVDIKTGELRLFHDQDITKWERKNLKW